MVRSDWVYVGLKLLGAYFAVHGAIALIAFTCATVLSLRQPNVGMPVHVNYFAIQWFEFLQPTIFLLCAFILIRNTEWCLHWICFEERREDRSQDAQA
jgi:hypothetical protein